VNRLLERSQRGRGGSARVRRIGRQRGCRIRGGGLVGAARCSVSLARRSRLGRADRTAGTGRSERADRTADRGGDQRAYRRCLALSLERGGKSQTGIGRRACSDPRDRRLPDRLGGRGLGDRQLADRGRGRGGPVDSAKLRVELVGADRGLRLWLDRRRHHRPECDRADHRRLAARSSWPRCSARASRRA
jgi:hypothetical protein